MLNNLNLEQSYHKPENDIAKEFYLPCLAGASNYDRAVGYFSSAIYLLAWPSLKKFIANDGKIRIICSPVLSERDSNALFEGYSERSFTVQSELLLEEFHRMLKAEQSMKPAKILSTLVALGHIDFRIAWVGESASAKSRRLFHDKLGIFKDESGNSVVFKGSMNETWAGLSLDGNLESVDVFLSWSNAREQERVTDEVLYFERLWNDEFKGVTVRPLSEVSRDKLVGSADIENLENLIDDICLELAVDNQWNPTRKSENRILRPHQLAALEAWENCGRRGIFKHATGSGKTFTALCAINDSINRSEIPLILVPSELLLEQWEAELRASFEDCGLALLVCGGGNIKWRTENLLRQWTRRPSSRKTRIVLAMMQTASSDSFLNLCVPGDHIFLVADEVHRLGSTTYKKILNFDSGPRLGLSATPERAGDNDGTDAIFSYFNGIVPPPFTLQDAISSGALTQYAYHIYRVPLSAEEEEKWAKYTKEIRKLYAQTQASGENRDHATDQLKFKLIERARIAKKAVAKIKMAASIVKEHFKEGNRWIVYCDDNEQLTKVVKEIRNFVTGSVYEYHSKMSGNKEKTLELFDKSGGVVVSIRCLDEGVDIPSVDTALILASSKNPREYIQRRGRVLRRYEGKRIAYIHDVLVTPTINPDESTETSLVLGEISRAIEFGRSALNPSCIADLECLAIEYNLDIEGLSNIGIEDDNDLEN